MLPDEAGMKLLKSPRRPTWIDLLEEAHRELINAWLPFIINKAG
jgi:hypothetical protein